MQCAKVSRPVEIIVIANKQICSEHIFILILQTNGGEALASKSWHRNRSVLHDAIWDVLWHVGRVSETGWLAHISGKPGV